jgi:hypothetical protein
MNALYLGTEYRKVFYVGSDKEQKRRTANRRRKSVGFT